MVAEKQGRRILGQLACLFVVFLLTVGVIYGDVLVMGSGMGEQSFVQAAQALLILGSAFLFFGGALRHADQRGYLIALATLFLCMFVRENDGALDHVYHGFWAVPVGVIAVIGAVAVALNAKTLRAPARRHAQDGSYWILMVGLFQLLVFSRLFGSGLLWDHVPGQAEDSAVKMIVQEGTELVSYALVFFGSALTVKQYLGRVETPLQDPSRAASGTAPAE